MKPGFWTFDHPILDKLAPFDSKKIPGLVTQVQNGHIEAKEELLYQLLAYIKTRLGKILYKESRLRNEVDGLISYLIEWLIEQIDKISQQKPVKNIVHYTSVSLKFRCFDYLDTLLAYGPTERRYYANITQQCICMNTIPTPANGSELLGCLQDITCTEIELEFIRLRTEGYKNKEIAQKLNLNPCDVSRIRKTLLKRFTDES
jgi:DNA-binding CsgD family transcriptional regulator